VPPARRLALDLVGLADQAGLFVSGLCAAAHHGRVASGGLRHALGVCVTAGACPGFVRATTLVEPLPPWCWGFGWPVACFGVWPCTIETMTKRMLPGSTLSRWAWRCFGARCGRLYALSHWSGPKGQPSFLLSRHFPSRRLEIWDPGTLAACRFWFPGNWAALSIALIPLAGGVPSPRKVLLKQLPGPCLLGHQPGRGHGGGVYAQALGWPLAKANVSKGPVIKDPVIKRSKAPVGGLRGSARC